MYLVKSTERKKREQLRYTQFWLEGPVKWLIILCLLRWENTAAASAAYEPIQTDEMLALANSQQMTHRWFFPVAPRMAVKPSPLKRPCVSKTGQWQQDKVLQPSLPGTERHKKVLLGCINREKHPKHSLLCEKRCWGEQLARIAILSALLQRGFYENYIILILAWKIYFMPPKIFEQIFLYYSQLPMLLAERVLEKLCRGSWTSQVTAAGRLPQEARERIICINAATKLFFCRSQSTLKSYSLSQRRENLDPEMQSVI